MLETVVSSRKRAAASFLRVVIEPPALVATPFWSWPMFPRMNGPYAVAQKVSRRDRIPGS